MKIADGTVDDSSVETQIEFRKSKVTVYIVRKISAIKRESKYVLPYLIRQV